MKPAIQVYRTPPEGGVVATAGRRMREAPAVLFAAALLTAALGVTVFGLATGDERVVKTSWLFVVLSALIALGSCAYLGSRFHRTPIAADETPHPIRVQWLDADLAIGVPAIWFDAHPVAGGLRLVARETMRSDLVWMLAPAAAAYALHGIGGAVAVAAIGRAVGLPRGRRLCVEVPWDAVAGAQHQRHGFRVHLSDSRTVLVLATRFLHTERLHAVFEAALGGRYSGTSDALAAPAPHYVLDSEIDDPAEGVAALALRRMRGRPLLQCGAALATLAAIGHVAGRTLGEPIVAAVSALAMAVGLIVAVVGHSTTATPKPYTAGAPWAPDDAPDPIEVSWSNRPGWFGPRPQRVHVSSETLRVVGSEWEFWDILVVVGLAIVGAVVAQAVGAVSVKLFASFIGLPRRRRIVADIPWRDVEWAEVRGPLFAIGSSLRPPADLVRLEAKYSARAKLTAVLAERLGSRLHIASTSAVPAREPGVEEIASAAHRIRDLRRRAE